MNRETQAYIRLGDSAAVRCVVGQTQYNSQYLTRVGNKPDLSEGLDWVDNPMNEHGILINPADACILAARIRKHRIAAGIVSEDDSRMIPCANCPNSEIVYADTHTYDDQ